MKRSAATFAAPPRLLVLFTLLNVSVRLKVPSRNVRVARALTGNVSTKEAIMGFGRGALLWLIGIPLPIIILLALFWH
jgi:hypothetical protein